MIGSLFFEVEGVLASTASLRRAALHSALADEGIALESSSELEEDLSGGARDLVRHALRGHQLAADETTVTLVTMRAQRHFELMIQAGVSLAPGARELVALAAATCRLAIVTGLDRTTVATMLSLADLDAAFEVVIASEDVALPKPAPDGYRKALERMGRRRALDLRSALALEPNAVGARAAHAAGLRCVVVAPYRAESIVDADAMLASLVGESPATLGAMLAVETAE
jgi:HAD superfamily hydrolase (TIGR01509 family)